MAPLTYKKRRRAFEGEDGREQAIRRLRDESSVRQKLSRIREAEQPTKKNTPSEQQTAAELVRRRSNRERETTSHGGAPASPRPFDAKRPRFPTTRGPHRLSFRQAYSHRTTDTSRARVLALYGRSAPPKGFSNRTLSKPVKPGRGDYGAGLPDVVAKMRSRALTRPGGLAGAFTRGVKPGRSLTPGTSRRRRRPITRQYS